MCTKCGSGQLWKNFTNFWTASFFSNACSTLRLSLSWAKQTAIESNAVTDQTSFSRRFRYTSKPPWALNCSLELRDAWAISHSRGNAYCFKGESDMIKCIKCGMIPFSAACSCLLLLILHRLNSAWRTFKPKGGKKKRKEIDGEHQNLLSVKFNNLICWQNLDKRNIHCWETTYNMLLHRGISYICEAKVLIKLQLMSYGVSFHSKKAYFA